MAAAHKCQSAVNLPEPVPGSTACVHHHLFIYVGKDKASVPLLCHLLCTGQPEQLRVVEARGVTLGRLLYGLNNRAVKS